MRAGGRNLQRSRRSHIARGVRRPRPQQSSRINSPGNVGVSKHGLLRVAPQPIQKLSAHNLLLTRHTPMTATACARSSYEAMDACVIDFFRRQAEVTKALAEATALVIREVRDIPGPCCIQSGSLLVIKSSGVDGSTSIASRTLSPMQLKKLEENQDMLQRPADIMPWLASADRGDTHGTAERAVEWTGSKAFQGVQHRLELPNAPRVLSIPAKGELVWLAEAIIQDFKARNSQEGELVGKFSVEVTPKLVAFVNWLLGEFRDRWRKRGAKGNKQVPLSQEFFHEIGEMIIQFGQSIGEEELTTPAIAEKLVASIGRLLEKHPNALIGEHRPKRSGRR